MREGARDLAGLPRLFANSVTLSIVLSVLAMPIMMLLGRSLGYDPATVQVLDVMSLAILPATLLILCDGVFVSRQRSSFVGFYTVVDMIVRVGIASLLLKWGYGVTAVVATLVGAQVMALAAAAFLVRRLGAPLRFVFDVATVKRLLSAAPTFVSITVFATLYWRVDVVMLSTLGSIREVGLYGAAYRFMDLIRILPQSLCMAVYPLISQAAVTDLKKLRRVGTETLRFLWAVTIPLVVGGTILAGPLLAFTVGEEFREASTTLSVLLWTAIPVHVRPLLRLRDRRREQRERGPLAERRPVRGQHRAERDAHPRLRRGRIRGRDPGIHLPLRQQSVPVFAALPPRPSRPHCGEWASRWSRPPSWRSSCGLAGRTRSFCSSPPPPSSMSPYSCSRGS